MLLPGISATLRIAVFSLENSEPLFSKLMINENNDCGYFRRFVEAAAVEHALPASEQEAAAYTPM
jgi:hypothetical protein